MTTDDILRGTVKEIIVSGAIVGFNRLEVNDRDIYKEQNETILELQHSFIHYAKSFHLLMLRYMQKKHSKRNMELKVKTRITHWNHMDTPMDE